MGLPVESTTLQFGDVSFVGKGVGGEPVAIAIEHKRLSDLVQSLTSDRLAGHQLPGMLNMYDRCWLIVEGSWAHDAAGRVTLFKAQGQRRPVKGAPSAITLEQRLLTLEIRGGLHVRCCPTRRDSLRFIQALYRFWTDRPLDQHTSHLALHAPDLDRALSVPVSLKRQLAAQLPGIGYTRSALVDAYFPTIQSMVNATVADWTNVPGIGKTIATELVEAMTV